MFYGKSDCFGKRRLHSSTIAKVKEHPNKLAQYTLCESAGCPNAEECISRGTATFLAMGTVCPRNCTFCAIQKGKPASPDAAEPDNIAEAVAILHLKYVSVTSVSRDDLGDGGAKHIAHVVKSIQDTDLETAVEVQIHDLLGSIEALATIIDVFPDVINHNIETVPRLFPFIRPEASYQRSLNLLRTVKELNPGIITKSGIMLGLGEKDYEVIKVMQDLRDVGCNSLTMGQYMPPSSGSQRLERHISPGEFEEYADLGAQMGFSSVRCGPFVRSSYDAIDMYKEVAQ
jgi:lipoyl synthase